MQIRKTLPAIAERLSTLQQSFAYDINDWGAKTKQLTHINTTLNDLLGGRVVPTLHSTRTAERSALLLL